ncbi:MAG: hypothetical protein RIK87_20730 [Fuerstiella sp.]
MSSLVIQREIDAKTASHRYELMKSVRCISGSIVRHEREDKGDRRLQISLFIQDGYELVYPGNKDAITESVRVRTDGHFTVGAMTCKSIPKVVKLGDYSWYKHRGLVELEAPIRLSRKLDARASFDGKIQLNVFTDTSGISYEREFSIRVLRSERQK